MCSENVRNKSAATHRGGNVSTYLQRNDGLLAIILLREMPLGHRWLMQHSHHCSAHSACRLHICPVKAVLHTAHYTSRQPAAASRLSRGKSWSLAARAPFRPVRHCRQSPPCKAVNGATSSNSDNGQPQRTASGSGAQSGYFRQQWSKYSEPFAQIAASTKLQLSAVLNPKFVPMVLL